MHWEKQTDSSDILVKLRWDFQKTIVILLGEIETWTVYSDRKFLRMSK